MQRAVAGSMWALLHGGEPGGAADVWLAQRDDLERPIERDVRLPADGALPAIASATAAASSVATASITASTHATAARSAVSATVSIHPTHATHPSPLPTITTAIPPSEQPWKLSAAAAAIARRSCLPHRLTRGIHFCMQHHHATLAAAAHAPFPRAAETPSVDGPAVPLASHPTITACVACSALTAAQSVPASSAITAAAATPAANPPPTPTTHAFPKPLATFTFSISTTALTLDAAVLTTTAAVAAAAATIAVASITSLANPRVATALSIAHPAFPTPPEPADPAALAAALPSKRPVSLQCYDRHHSRWQRFQWRQREPRHGCRGLCGADASDR